MSIPTSRARLELLDELGEEAVFRGYLEHGSVRALVAALFEPAPGYEDAQQYGCDELYRWLHDETDAPGRWERWQKVRELRGHLEADLVLEEAMRATRENASAQRVKVDALKWRAGVLNRDTYGPPQAQTQVNVGLSVGEQWLAALRALSSRPEGEVSPVRGELTEARPRIESGGPERREVHDPPLDSNGGAA